MSDDHVRELDCTDCGRHIISLCGPRPALDGSDRCAACLSIPEWWKDPEVARMIDPEHNRTVGTPRRPVAISRAASRKGWRTRRRMQRARSS